MKRILSAGLKNYYIPICLILGIACLTHFFLQKTYYYPYTYSKKDTSSLERKENISYEKIFHTSVTDTMNRKELSLFLFENRKEHYAGTLETLSTSINRMAFLVLVSIMLLYFQPSDLELFGIKIPNLAIYLIVPICILYYWLLFGFSLFNALASRESLFHLSRSIEQSYFKNDGDAVYLIHSSRSSLEDVGIVDAWSNVFMGFYDKDYRTACANRNIRKAKLNSDDPAVAVGLFLIFGGLQALAMGSAQSMIYYYKKHLARRNKKLLVLLEVVLFAYFILSHVTFFFAMPYSTPYLASIWFLAAIFFYFTLRALNKIGSNSNTPEVPELIKD
jgi:hypothetical protein